MVYFGQVALAVNTQKMTVKELEEAVLKKALNMVAPDARLDDGSGSIIISSEEGETDHNNNKTLAVSLRMESLYVHGD